MCTYEGTIIFDRVEWVPLVQNLAYQSQCWFQRLLIDVTQSIALSTQVEVATYGIALFKGLGAPRSKPFTVYPHEAGVSIHLSTLFKV